MIMFVCHAHIYFWELLSSTCKSLFVFRGTNLTSLVISLQVLLLFSPLAAQMKDPQRNSLMLKVDNLAELASLTEVGLGIGLSVSLRGGDCW